MTRGRSLFLVLLLALAAAEARPAAAGDVSADPRSPGAEEASAALASLRIGFREHQGFRRVVFYWREPVTYALGAKRGRAWLRFDRAAKLDETLLAAALPQLAPALDPAEGATVITLKVPPGMRLRHFKSGNNVVLDIIGAGTMPAAKAPSPVVPPPELIQPSAGSPPEQALPAVPTPGPLPVHVALSPPGASLRFDWPKPTAAAVFARGSALWIVFAGATPIDLAEPRRLADRLLAGIEQVADSKATVLRLIVQPGLGPSVRRAENSWIVELKPEPPRPDRAVVAEMRRRAGTPSLLFAFRDAAEPVHLHDPEVGDTLVVVPAGDPGSGVATQQAFVDFRALASVQGLALRPNVDDLHIDRVTEGVEVSKPGGLLVSTEGERRFAAAPQGLARLFDFAGWRGRQDETFLKRRSRLEQAVAAASPEDRVAPRLALARFYFARLYAAEAKGVIEALLRDTPNLVDEPSVALMLGAVELMTGDDRAAAEDLARKNLDNQPETGLWRASLAAENGDWPVAADGFVSAISLLSAYPKPLRDRFALQAAEALLETGSADAVAPVIQLVLDGDPPLADKAMALYLDGRRAQRQDDLKRAIGLWNEVAGMGDRRSRARALFARTTAQLEAGQIGRGDAIKALDGLRFAWRGDMVEFALLRRLGELKLADGDQRGAFEAWREAAVNFADYPAAKDVMTELSDAFADVFLGDGAKEQPLKALALYDEFKDFAPVGERGDAMVRRLVDRLVAVDLLDRAAALLEEQVDHRLTGQDKARVATQLALLRLLDHNPETALKALDIDVGKDLPPELLRQRQQLRARALTELDRGDEALAILGSDTSRDADRLRADIFWRSHNWRAAAKAMGRFVPLPDADGKLDKETARLVLDLASALTLAGDWQGLGELRTLYAKAMADTPFGDAFRIIAGDTRAGSGESDPRAIASRVAQVSELQSFMANLKERLAKDKLSAIN